MIHAVDGDVYCRMGGWALMASFIVSRWQQRASTMVYCRSVNTSLLCSLVCPTILTSVFLRYRRLCYHGRDWTLLPRQLFVVVMPPSCDNI